MKLVMPGVNKNWAKIALALAIILLLSALPAIVHAQNDSFENKEESSVDDMNELIDEQSGSSGFESIEDGIGEYSGEGLNEIIEDYNTYSIIKDLATGKLDLNPKSIIAKILNLILKELYLNVNIIAKFIIVAILSAIIKNLQTSFMSGGVSELAFYVSYIVMVSIMVASLGQVFKIGNEIIGSMVDFMYATAPVLVTLMVSNGNIISGSIMQPISLLVVETAASVFRTVFIPLTTMAAAVSIVNNISQNIKLSRLAELLKKICTWGIGLFLTVFAAIIAIQGSLGSVIDGIASKSLKFTISSIPVIGKYMADAAETVLGCTLVLKNAASAAVMLGIVGMAIMPLLKLGAVIIMYKIAGAIIEPISDKRLTECIDDVAKAMATVFGIVTAVVIMFLITVTAIVMASNLSTMVR
ncbi:MAG: stage III sporulation protein AE [Eubacteriales bacterium]|nr:stage III sporulation protein AE [Eubacteriales bacterium]